MGQKPLQKASKSRQTAEAGCADIWVEEAGRGSWAQQEKAGRQVSHFMHALGSLSVPPSSHPEPVAELTGQASQSLLSERHIEANP